MFENLYVKFFVDATDLETDFISFNFQVSCVSVFLRRTKLFDFYFVSFVGRKISSLITICFCFLYMSITCGHLAAAAVVAVAAAAAAIINMYLCHWSRLLLLLSFSFELKCLNMRFEYLRNEKK